MPAPCVGARGGFREVGRNGYRRVAGEFRRGGTPPRAARVVPSPPRSAEVPDGIFIVVVLRSCSAYAGVSGWTRLE